MIHIREDYRYFTHLPGKESVIPLTKAVAKVYPCRIEISAQTTSILDLQITGPVKGFTHLLNIEKGRVEVFGTAKEGYFHLVLTGRDGKVIMKLHRGKELSLILDSSSLILKKGEEIELLSTETMNMPERREKVSFGCFKKPLLEKGILRVSKLYSLAQMIPESSQVTLEAVEPLLIDLFSPKTDDPLHRGLDLQSTIFDKFSLFPSFYSKYRARILKEQDEEISFLNGKLPHAGRATGLQCNGCTIDLLWKKGKVIRLILHPTEDSSKKLIFPGKTESFRIKGYPKERGKIVPANTLISVEKGKSLYIDRIHT